MGWNYLSIPKLQRLHQLKHWPMNNLFHFVVDPQLSLVCSRSIESETKWSVWVVSSAFVINVNFCKTVCISLTYKIIFFYIRYYGRNPFHVDILISTWETAAELTKRIVFNANLFNKIEWYSVSNALDKSRNIEIRISPRSIVSYIVSMNSMAGRSIEWCFPNPYWLSNTVSYCITLTSYHQPYYCLLNCSFRRRSKKTSKLYVTGFVRGSHQWPVNSTHKRLVTRKIFPFDNVIMCHPNIYEIDWIRHVQKPLKLMIVWELVYSYRSEVRLVFFNRCITFAIFSCLERSLYIAIGFLLRKGYEQ